MWLTDQEGRRVSTIDLVHNTHRFVVLSVGDHAAETSSEAITAVDVGRDYACTAGQFAKTYALRPGGFVVVRPDGHVAHRSRSGQGARTIDEVISAVAD